MSLLICISVYLGVDPEIYELTTAKTENNATGHYIADAFTKLMESMEKTRTTARLDICIHECTHTRLTCFNMLSTITWLLYS